MGQFGTYWEQQILKHITNQTSMTQGTLWIGACTAAPMTAAGTNLALAECEPRATANYARISINVPAGWTVVSGSSPAVVRNTSPITWLAATSCAWGTIGWLAIFNTSTILTGEVLAWGTCTSVAIGTGDTLTLGTQSLTLQLT